MPVYPNKYPGRCAKCGASVDKLKGSYERGIVYCAQHASGPIQAPGDPNLISVTVQKTGPALDCDEVVFAPTGHLGDRFDAFRNSCSGLQYGGKSTYATPNPNLAATTAVRLRKNGFALKPSDEAKSFLDGSREKQEEELRAADERLASVDALSKKAGYKGIYPYQRQGVRWLVSRPTGAALFDDTGVGKTLQTLASFPYNARAIVVCPASVKGVWQKETKRWRPDLRTSVFAGRGTFRWPEKGEIVITNYDILPKHQIVKDGKFELLVPSPELQATLPSDVIIVADEAHYLKEYDAARTKNFRALATAIRKACGKTIVLSGTPMKNKPPELWSVLQAAGLATEAFGNRENFVRIFHGRKGTYGEEWPMVDPEPEAADLLKRVSLRRMKVDVVADVPDKSFRTEEVEIDAKTARACDEALSEAESKYGNIESAIERLKGMGTSLGFDKMSKARTLLAKAKIPRMKEIVEEYEDNETPLVVFAAHRDPIDLLGQRPGWAIITGEVSIPRRNQIIDDFQAGRLKGVAATIGAGGTGITLTRAFTLLMVDREWSPADNLQAEDRVWRVGQKNAVTIIDLVAKHILDERLYEKLGGKQRLIQGSIGATNVIHKEEDLIAAIDWSVVEKEAKKSALDAEEARKRGATEEERAHKRRLRERVSAAAARRLSEPVEAIDAPRRPAQNAVELWAAHGIVTLAALDPDRAKEKNEMGFSASDGSIGHALAVMFSWGDGALTEQEWRLAVQIAGRYPNQIGSRPARELSEAEILEAANQAAARRAAEAEARATRAGTREGRKADVKDAKVRIEDAHAEVRVMSAETKAANAEAEAKLESVEAAQKKLDKLAASVDPKGKLAPEEHLAILAETHPELVAEATEGAVEATQLAEVAVAKESELMSAAERLAQAHAAALDLVREDEEVAQAKVENRTREEAVEALRGAAPIVVEAVNAARSVDIADAATREIFTRFLRGDASESFRREIAAEAEKRPKAPTMADRVVFAALFAIERDVYRRAKGDKLSSDQAMEARLESEAEARMAMNAARALPSKELPTPPFLEENLPPKTVQEKRRYRARARKRVEAAPSLPAGQVYAYHHGVMMPERVVVDLGDFAITEE